MPDRKYAVIFDMDGVLVDTESVINKAAILGLQEYGIDPKPDDFIPFIGRGEVKYVGGVAEKYGLEYKPEMKDRVYEIYFDILHEMLQPVDGVNKCLDALAFEKYPLVLASSADHRKIDANLAAAKINPDIFQVILAAEDVVHKKPAPDIYLKAAKSISKAPENCIVVEDALNGIQAAKAAGMKCIALSSTFSYKKLENEQPDFICDSFDQILSIVLNG